MNAPARRALVESIGGFDPIPPGESGSPIGRSRNAMPASGSHVIAAEANVFRAGDGVQDKGGQMTRKGLRCIAAIGVLLVVTGTGELLRLNSDNTLRDQHSVPSE
jgi:hypothetical protein